MRPKNLVTITLFLLLFLCFVFLNSDQSHALQISWDLNQEYSGAADPSGDPPWMTIIFDDEIVPDSVLITVLANLTNEEFVHEILVNVDDSVQSDISEFSYLTISSAPEPGLFLGYNSFKAGGDGYFDFRILFQEGSENRFESSEVLYILAQNPLLTAESFNQLSINGPQELYCAAHIGGIGENGEDSGWITGGTIPTPEPSTIALFLLGAPLFLFRRKRLNG